MQHLVDLVGVPHLFVDRLPIARAEHPGTHQMIDEETVAAVGGNAAGGGMRLLQVSEVLEVGHDVAEARRRELKTAGSSQRSRADGLACRYVLDDDLAQHLAGAAVEIVSMKVEFLHGRC